MLSYICNTFDSSGPLIWGTSPWASCQSKALVYIHFLCSTYVTKIFNTRNIFQIKSPKNCQKIYINIFRPRRALKIMTSGQMQIYHNQVILSKKNEVFSFCSFWADARKNYVPYTWKRKIIQERKWIFEYKLACKEIII